MKSDGAQLIFMYEVIWYGEKHHWLRTVCPTDHCPRIQDPILIIKFNKLYSPKRCTDIKWLTGRQISKGKKHKNRRTRACLSKYVFNRLGIHFVFLQILLLGQLLQPGKLNVLTHLPLVHLCKCNGRF
jgi:hypothetical protein